ncbi:hypothetical protein [Thioalkalivibrio sulfidiphilus]|uniref:hypothetical protein n=1 Tax=Thioalkalivibrio sulfidiphilus TaxID=1033854 RepID=UPI003B2F9682
MSSTPQHNVICMKWGTAYGARDVNVLHNMVTRFLSLSHRFICFTDDPSGLNEGIEHFPLPEVHVPPRLMKEAWLKLGTFSNPLADLSGTALFLDLDIVIVDSIDCFFEHPGQFCIIHNWTHPDRIVGNSSVYRFNVGDLSWVLDRYHEAPDAAKEKYRNEQAFLSHTLNDAGVPLSYWPEQWCVSFKKHCMPPRVLTPFITPRKPRGAKIIAFHGHPKPDEALRGEWKGRWKKMRPTPWISDYWG